MIANTLYIDAESNRKQLTLANWAVSALKGEEESSLTKGLIANEALLLANDDISDSLTDVESEVDRRLSAATHSNVPEMVAELKKSEDHLSGHSLLYDQCEYPNPDAASGTTDIYLLDYICDWLPARGANEVIEDSLIHVASTPWNSRTEKIQAKQQLARFAETEKKPDDVHAVVEDIIEGESLVWDVDAVHNEVMSKDWWGRNDVTSEDLMSRGDEIPQKPRELRLNAVQTAIDNQAQEHIEDGGESEVTEASVIDWITRVMVGKETAQRYYLPEISLGPESVQVTIVDDVLSEVASNLRDKRTDEELAKLPSGDATILGFSKNIDEVDGQYPNDELAQIMVKSILEGDYDRSDLQSQPQFVLSAHKSAIRAIESKLESEYSV